MQPTLLLTRPRPQSERFGAQCRLRLGEDLRLVISPVLEIRYRDANILLRDGEVIVVSSANGLEALARLVDLRGRLAYCVGDATADVARGFGMRAISAGGTAGDLIALLLREAPGGQLLYARGTETRGNVAEALQAAGLSVRSVVLYDQVPHGFSEEALSLLRRTSRVILPLFSPRSAALAGKAAGGWRGSLEIVALSQAVAEAWGGAKPDIMAVCPYPTAQSMLDMISRRYAPKSP